MFNRAQKIQKQIYAYPQDVDLYLQLAVEYRRMGMEHRCWGVFHTMLDNISGPDVRYAAERDDYAYWAAVEQHIQKAKPPKVGPSGVLVRFRKHIRRVMENGYRELDRHKAFWIVGVPALPRHAGGKTSYMWKWLRRLRLPDGWRVRFFAVEEGTLKIIMDPDRDRDWIIGPMRDSA
jgi:hypothetical protein